MKCAIDINITNDIYLGFFCFNWFGGQNGKKKGLIGDFHIIKIY